MHHQTIDTGLDLFAVSEPQKIMYRDGQYTRPTEGKLTERLSDDQAFEPVYGDDGTLGLQCAISGAKIQ